MSAITFEVKLFQGPLDRPRSQKALLWLMEGLVQVNEGWLRSYQTPGIYQSGVYYRFDENEPDPWQDIPTTIEKGWGDCEDLACWRIAELRAKENVMARPYIRWRKKGEGYVYHALVWLPDGRIEDPSLALGMRGPIVNKPVYLPVKAG